MKILLVYNTFAGNKRGKKLLPQIEARLNENKIDFDLKLTEYPQHGIKIVKETDFDVYDGIVASGGDGTLFDVINGYYQNRSKKRIPIGIIPTGTGNAFARELDLNSNLWPEAINIISSNKTKKVDVGRFRTRGQDYYYLNILGLGFVADVVETARKLKFLGNISYTFGVFYHISVLNTHRLTIKIDGNKIEQENIFVEISNTRYTSNFLMSPNAKIDDGLLDVTILRKVNRRKLLKSFPKMFTGEHIFIDEVDTFQAKNITVITDNPKVLTPDGELIGHTPVEVECLHHGIDMFWK